MSSPRRVLFFDRDSDPISEPGGNGVGIRLRASVFQHVASDIAPGGSQQIALSTGNIGDNLRGNSFYGLGAFAGQRGGYDNGSGNVQLTRPLGLLEAFADDVVTAAENPMQYDFFERRRPETPSRGPVEAHPLLVAVDGGGATADAIAAAVHAHPAAVAEREQTAAIRARTDATAEALEDVAGELAKVPRVGQTHRYSNPATSVTADVVIEDLP